MFGPVIATEEFAMAPGCNVQVAPQEPEVDAEGCGDSDEAIPLDQTLDDLFEGGTSEAGLTGNRKRTVESTGGGNSSHRMHRGKKQTGGATMLVRHLDTLVGAVASRSSTVNSKVIDPLVPTIRAVVINMKTLPGLDINGDLFMWATEFLEDKMKREVYTELDTPAHKINWLNYHYTRKGSKNL